MQVENICLGCMEEKGPGICKNCSWDNSGHEKATLQLRPGTILNNKYLVGKVLGQGGFGITYLGRHLNLGIKLAIKEYFPSGVVTRSNDSLTVCTFASNNVSEQFNYGIGKFLEEAQILAQFEEVPTIVSVKDFFMENGTAYLIMSYVDGVTLKDFLQSTGGRLRPDVALGFLLPVMEALDQIHKRGILHRDISPDNIYITKNYNVKLLDFGAARFAMGEHSRSLSVILKPGYAPEEQYRSKGKQGPWTDVYSVAATIYKVLTGETPPEAMDRLEEDTLKKPSDMGVEIPANIEAALIKALAIRQADRYQTMSEFFKSLQAPSNPKKVEIRSSPTEINSTEVSVGEIEPKADNKIDHQNKIKPEQNTKVICQHCGTKNLSQLSFCKSCFKKLDKSIPCSENPRYDSNNSKNTPSQENPTCNSNNLKNTPSQENPTYNSNYLKDIWKMSDKTKYKTCYKCGYKNPLSQKICNNCYSQL